MSELQERIKFRKAALKELRAAYLALVDGRAQSYTIGSRTLTRLDLTDLGDEIRELEDELDELEASADGNGGRRVIPVIPMNW